MSALVLVRLDDARRGSGPATVVALTGTVPRDRDQCADDLVRVWRGYDGVAVGDRVILSAIDPRQLTVQS